MALQYIRRATSFEDLAYKWLRQDKVLSKGGCDPVLRKTVQNICYTWIAFFYAILKVRPILIMPSTHLKVRPIISLYTHSHFTLQEQPLWISPERADKIRPPAFKSHIANNTGHISDCTNLDLGNCFMSNPLASSLLRSFYYSGICCKYLVDISRCGGTCAVSHTHGGSKASDER